MAERAADRAPVARLPVPDLQQGFMHDRPARAHRIGKFEVALARHGADFERALGLADVGQSFHAVEIDDVVGQHEPHVEHGHQRLAAGEQLGIFEAAEQPDGLAHRFRIVITERRWLHLGWTVPGRTQLLYIHQQLCINPKKINFPNMGQSAVIVRPCFDLHRNRGEQR